MLEDSFYDVFLGGSCGPTTWRTDEVVPYLEKIGITFYNPQRKLWSEDAIKTEEIAKRRMSLPTVNLFTLSYKYSKAFSKHVPSMNENSCRLLLFVIDSRQVSLVSLIEISFLAAKGAPLIVVLPSNEDIASFDGHHRADRIRAFEFVRNVLQRHKIPQFKRIDDALRLIENLVIGERCVSEIVRDPRCYSVFCKLTFSKGFTRVLNFVRDAATYLSPYYLIYPFQDPKVWRIFRPRCRTDWLKLNLLIIELLLFITLCFCCPAVPVILVIGVIIIIHIAVLVLFPVHWLNKDRPRQPKRVSSPATYDVYLGGSGNRFDWIKHIALPILNKGGLSYMDSTFCDFHHRVTILPHCRYIFFVVNCMESMKSGLVELAYYVGSGFKVIGCITVVIPSANIKIGDLEESGLTETTAECYRRGMLYLKDMAFFSGVPILDDLSSALDYLVQKIRLGLDSTDSLQ